MDSCRNLRKYSLLSLCIIVLILGQVCALPKVQVSHDEQDAVRRYNSAVSLAFCVPSSFDHQMLSLATSGYDFPLCISVSEAEPLFKQADSDLPPRRQIWLGLPSLRSPPFFA